MIFGLLGVTAYYGNKDRGGLYFYNLLLRKPSGQ